MSNNTEDQITQNVLNSMANTPNPRLKEVMDSLVKHLHAFIREVGLTQEEWMQGIMFLTRTGQMCDDRRQEFILLSDVTGVSMLVDAINHRVPDGATENTIFGPFYREGAPELPMGASISLDGKGEPAVVMGRVLSTTGEPVPNALLDIWEGGENGLYEQQDPEQPDMNLRGKFRTDNQGRYRFIAIKPVPYPIPDDGPVGQLLRSLARHPYRPAHIHLLVSAEGYVPVTTHLFVKGDPYLDSDAVFGTKDSLVVEFVRHESGEEATKYGVSAPFYTVEYDFVLKPVNEQVYLGG
ncbi:MAG TPA: intradiol ring-cleavage dioxygenase [Ktedonobacteraceae bacterium]|jgi:protocatechuate 3,4-dioxygenase beta subunit|nr:intradiol ring-cleavage dioxygenase [Ktedonobacteraceae bacterium]